MFPTDPVLSSSSIKWVPIISVYEEAEDMTLLWSKTYNMPDHCFFQISFSPNGLKIVA